MIRVNIQRRMDADDVQLLPAQPGKKELNQRRRGCCVRFRQAFLSSAGEPKWLFDLCAQILVRK